MTDASSFRVVSALGAVAVMALCVVLPAAASPCSATSPANTVALIELYTSEGCDSCPPADRWFSGIDRDLRGGHAVELAFHVDYWDRLGWKDRFASETYTDRQYEQMRRRNAGFVFTPQVLVQGRDFPQWRSSGQPAAAVAAINAKPARATIELTAEPARNGIASVVLHAQVADPRDRNHAIVTVALVQGGLGSDVKAGENSGKHLAHDHVVREWRAGLPVDASGEASEQFRFKLPADTGPMTIVALAENSATGDVLQTLSLPVCTQ